MRRFQHSIVVRITLALLIVPLGAVQVLAADELGLPIHPDAIPSSIVRQSGDGEGTRWVRVGFKINAPYDQVVKFYREKTGKHAQISQIDSGKLLNTLILWRNSPQDQVNVNIRSEQGRRVTEVELSRNFASP